jgi:hypothetical protein
MHTSGIAHVLKDDPFVAQKVHHSANWIVIMGLEWERHNKYSAGEPSTSAHIIRLSCPARSPAPLHRPQPEALALSLLHM